jgi:hypothetical protein
VAEPLEHLSRRGLLRGLSLSLGALAAGALRAPLLAAPRPLAPEWRLPGEARARRVLWLFMEGGPSHIDLFDPKPLLARRNGESAPAELFEGERFAFIKGPPKLLGSPFAFARHGDSGAELSELLPNTAAIADRLTFVRGLRTTAFNHAPAQVLMNSGHDRLGRPSFGAWISWGLGTLNPDLPAHVVLTSGAYQPSGGAALWGNAFLPGEHQGVRLRGGSEPVHFLADPAGLSREDRRRSLDTLRALNELALARDGDPQIAARIAQYELAWRMQSSMPQLCDLAREPSAVREAYGIVEGRPGFADNCLLARRLLESDVRFVQLYHWGWDSHGTGESDDLLTSLRKRCQETDRACARLVLDLEERGLLEDTLVVWGGEFGRTPMNEERDGSKFLGRDHHPHANTIWLAGGGLKAGLTHGATDEFGCRVVEGAMDVHDLHATLLHQLGIDHERFTYRSQGRDFRLTDVSGVVQRALLA